MLSNKPTNKRTPQASQPMKDRGDNAARVHPESILRIKNLEMRARIVVQGFMSGLHRSPYHGFSVEFSDYRQYSPGDDLRHLDWKMVARADRYYVKRFEDETNLRCYILLDNSTSMNFSSVGYSKYEYAKTIAATLSYFLYQQRDAVGLLTFAETIANSIPPKYRPGHLRRLFVALDQQPTGQGTNVAAPINEIAQLVSRRGLVILISDLLAPVEQLETSLSNLRARGHDVMILRVLDPKETNFDFREASMFEDLESGQELYVDPATIAQSYQQKFTAHQNALKSCCDQLGVDLFPISTEDPIEKSLFDLLQKRAQRGSRMSRPTSATTSQSTPGGSS